MVSIADGSALLVDTRPQTKAVLAQTSAGMPIQNASDVSAEQTIDAQFAAMSLDSLT